MAWRAANGKGRRVMGAALLAVLAVGLALAGEVRAAATPTKPMPRASEALLAEGRTIYFRRCSFCHGLLGDGEGPAAEFLDPRPRDFTLGTFKFRTTQSGELPTDEDLFRTVSRGLPGTAMQAFDGDLIKSGLSEDERWAVIAYIQTFAPEFDDPELDPVATGMVVALPAARPALSDELVARGKTVFERAKCWECHGKLGRGDGQKSFDRKDDWGFPIRIRNVTHAWKIKAGAEVEDIYMRFSTGVNGTPMPSFVKALSEDERWALATYIKSLQHRLTGHQVLKVVAIEGELPETPDAELWARAEAMDVRLAGQVVAPPRWQNPSIELVTLRALSNAQEIAFLLEWDDPFKDTSHDPEAEFEVAEISTLGAYNSYVAGDGMVRRKLETFRDAIALQFPVKSTDGTKKPHFFRGDPSNPVQLWRWRADLEAQDKPAADELIARGWRQPAKAQAPDQQQVTAQSIWKQGRWSVVLKRALQTPDRNDVQFTKGTFIPVAINAWDGSNGEHGLIMSLSSWYFVVLEAPTPIGVYLYSALAVLITAALGFGLMRKVEREGTAPSDA